MKYLRQANSPSMPAESIKDHLERILKANHMEEAFVREVLEIGRHRHVKAGTVLMGPGTRPEEMPILISGLLKVMRQDKGGHEVLLYYIEGGETCAMSISCCMENSPINFHVVAEEDSDLWFVPVGMVDRWVQRFTSFRKFVFDTYHRRFEELLNTIENVVFKKLDERLYDYLLDIKQASGSFVINKTHEQIARELGTSRVVISRLLKKLEKEEKIEQSRNRIEVL
jgi:CRP/FNR family transcriptional regulator, anaerobic regulatory protein